MLTLQTVNLEYKTQISKKVQVISQIWFLASV